MGDACANQAEERAVRDQAFISSAINTSPQSVLQTSSNRQTRLSIRRETVRSASGMHFNKTP